MARGQRRTLKEKLEAELNSTRESISQYENALITMKSKEKELQKQLEEENMKELISLMKEYDCSINDLKNLIENQNTAQIEEMEQGA